MLEIIEKESSLVQLKNNKFMLIFKLYQDLFIVVYIAENLGSQR